MWHPTKRLLIDVYGVVFSTIFLLYFAICSPIRVGDRAPMGGQHSLISVVITYVVASFVLCVALRDAAHCMRAGGGLVRRGTRARFVTVQTGTWAWLPTVRLRESEALQVCADIKGARDELVKLHYVLARPGSASDRPRLICEEHALEVAWESEFVPAVTLAPYEPVRDCRLGIRCGEPCSEPVRLEVRARPTRRLRVH